MTAAVLDFSPIPAPVTIRPAPRREPPYDDEIGDRFSAPRSYDRRLPFDVAPTPPVWRAEPPRPHGLPDAAQWARRLVIGLIETAAGRRPLHQLGGMLSPSVIRGLSADFERAARDGSAHWLHRAAPRTIRASGPSDDVRELCGTVQVGARVRAIALRLEAHHGRWRCTRLQLG